MERPVARNETARRGWGWLVVGALFFLSTYLFLSSVVLPWVRGIEARWELGPDGVYHVQAYLKQGDSQDNPSGLYAYLSHGMVIVTVVQDGQAKTYPLTFAGSNPSGYLVTLEIRDLNGDGKPDVLVHVGELAVPMYNNGKYFQGTKP